ncbi:MAG: CopG family transcriptional regulator [Nitrososphaerota archaeon]|nr:ribbon-helix-helix domain-containing protein [Nitrososphaerales archaeon]MCX8191579.1 ribbon-helix-helix domain-containing protein [Nitrososphaerales archaeon]MDW8045051.1 CopG family transcriptional regulator [Nitrososphaerota archaeon]
MVKKDRTAVTLSKELSDMLKERARREGISVSELLEKIILKSEQPIEVERISLRPICHTSACHDFMNEVGQKSVVTVFMTTDRFIREPDGSYRIVWSCNHGLYCSNPSCEKSHRK